ncbi:hypothetical protein SYNPS1DRAFT_22401 [Syncephalis pseudoplumigaleata]|uniref:NAD-dependent epimerase/dehydratase domain-containing protein n=1 Tax=Syncephalis pseudoplumigaleata TaxID=1712513 RepID=A0A4P9YZR8_9FUNG|nr:hypothetical protein SYNPS1DRAFT_22401 [Syncephalis pseudoplumigaleata]|eukprot:RKP25683.1 hypothetical protein SYNPS1DRAFT_22401 [Syncephalis pseudoplumigaleata]
MPSAIVVGGLTLVGRNLVSYLTENNICHPIRVIDRSVPAAAFLNQQCRAAFDKVEFRQVNLVNEEAVARSFEPAEGHDGWDYVFNCSTEDRYGEVDQVYKERVMVAGVNCANEAAKRKVKVFVQLSTGCVYNETDHNGPACDETAPVQADIPRTKYHLETDQKIMATPELNAVIVRTALVYGPGDFFRFAPFLALNTVIQYKQWKMECPRTANPRRNSVHVFDVAAAMCHLAKWYCDSHQTGTHVFNVSDQNDTRFSEMFTIYSKYQRKNNGAEEEADAAAEPEVIDSEAELLAVRDELNEMSGPVWLELLEQSGISVTPVSPTLCQEYFTASPASVNGQKIVRETGFAYKYPHVEFSVLEDMVNDLIQEKLWPSVQTA